LPRDGTGAIVSPKYQNSLLIVYAFWRSIVDLKGRMIRMLSEDGRSEGVRPAQILATQQLAVLDSFRKLSILRLVINILKIDIIFSEVGA
jgi:hypothetical protein